ncbi:MAG: serine/threonine protein kinase [Deltaproteobacteria bacterium]|nr:serine/threonine protein kinase [Deltaproteobacteria bacterium]
MALPGKVRLAPWSPAGSRGEARAYVQARLTLFSKLMFWIFWILVAFLIGLYRLWPSIRPAKVGFVFECALFGQAVFASIWYFGLHRNQLSLEWLYRLDAVMVILIGVEFANSAYFQSDLPSAIYSAFIWHTFTIFARTIVVPSSGARTAVVTGLSFVPLIVSGVLLGVFLPERLDVPALPLTGGTIMYAAVAVLLATTGSRLIYGLRRQVSEAMQLGQYTLEEKIGEGGMGAVYRATHAMLRRPTAVKLLPPDRYDQRSLKRFEREVQAMSRLTHPNTVAVYDYGRSLDGVFYYAMEYLDGIDLESLVRGDGPQPAPRVVHILRQVCGALSEAHGVGLTHRDIKPANVILCQRGGTPDVVKVVDFGLVKEITHTTDDTGTKIIAGTPAYLSPEAVTDPERVGPASDLYALGAVGYFLLTGHHVFDGKTVIHVCTQHVTAVPTPPSQRTANPIPAELEALILGCLAKDPAARPADAQTLRSRLGALPGEWDETLASVWWTEFAARRAAVPPTAARPMPLTITREIAGLTDIDVGIAATHPVIQPVIQPAKTGQVT